MQWPDVELENGQRLPNPINDSSIYWKDDMKLWPDLGAPQITTYLIESKACDLKQMKAYRSLDSYNYLVSGWVGQILIHKITDVCFLKGHVNPSQRLSSDSHSAWVCVMASGEVISAGCSCMAGRGHVCSHAAALLWKIEAANRLGLTGLSCTDVSASWNRGSRKNVTPDLIQNINFKKPRVEHISSDSGGTNSSKALGTHKIRQFYSCDEVFEHIKENGLQELFEEPSIMLSSLITATQPLSTNRPPVHVENIKHTCDSYSFPTLPESCKPCAIFYKEYIALTPENAKRLERETELQASELSSLWKDSRRIRITASTASKVPKKETTNPANFLQTHIYKPFKGNADTAYGTVMESEARDFFCRLTDHTVYLTGTVVSADEPWLSASPDGLIESDKILEIKCPNPQKFQTANVDIQRIDGECVLDPKGRRGYYTQVQLTMFCTKRTACIFFVYLKESFIMVQCTYDKDYVKGVLSKLKRFYFLKFLPKLTNDHKAGFLSISQSYKKFASPE